MLRYANLRIDGREDEIPDPEYPKNEWDTCADQKCVFVLFSCSDRFVFMCHVALSCRYPLPVWKQDMVLTPRNAAGVGSDSIVLAAFFIRKSVEKSETGDPHQTCRSGVVSEPANLVYLDGDSRDKMR